MNAALVLSSYVAALILAVYLLWRFSHVGWYWHFLSATAAFVLGMMPPIPEWTGPAYDLVLGGAFIFLSVWGLGEPLFRWFHLPRHA